MDDFLLSTEHNMMLPHAGGYTHTHTHTHEYLKQKYIFQTELDLHREITVK